MGRLVRRFRQLPGHVRLHGLVAFVGGVAVEGVHGAQAGELETAAPVWMGSGGIGRPDQSPLMYDAAK